jgi:predicted metal-dependent phosphoesterase TrpH
MKLLYHVHSNYSYDCVIKPSKLVDFAIQNNIEALAITDHNSLNGSLKAAEYTKKKNYKIEVIIGAEYSTDCGDIIGLFLKEEISVKNAIGVITEIHRQGGLVILPHPTRGHNLNEEILNNVDIIEVFNSRSSEQQNNEAMILAKKYEKPIIAGADAHLINELNCYNILIPEDIRKGLLLKKEFIISYSNTRNKIISKFIKAWKTKSLKLHLLAIKSFISYYMIQPLKNRSLKKQLGNPLI